MVDIDSLLDAPADEHKRPTPLPAGNYFGVVTGFKFDKSREKETPYVRYTIRLTHPGEDAQEVIDAEKLEVDFSNKTMTKDFYLTADASYMLSEFLVALGIKTKGKSLRELIPQVEGHNVAVYVIHETDPKNVSRVYNRVDQIRPA